MLFGARQVLALTVVLTVVMLLGATARAERSDEQRSLAGLTARIVADLAAGKPLVVEVHVPLCDNTIIRRDATSAYAAVQRSTFQHVAGLFSNPSDTRWHAQR